MSTTTKITPEIEAIAWIAGTFLLYLSAGGVPLGAPTWLREFFAAIGASTIIIKYVLSQVTPPNLPPSHESVLAFIAVVLAVAAGFIGANLGSHWYGGFALEVIAAVLGVYVAMGGVIPPLPAPTAVSTGPGK